MKTKINDEWKKRYEKLLELIDGVEYSAQQWQEIVEEHLVGSEGSMTPKKNCVASLVEGIIQHSVEAMELTRREAIELIGEVIIRLKLIQEKEV